jgi:hypothetical protein
MLCGRLVCNNYLRRGWGLNLRGIAILPSLCMQMLVADCTLPGGPLTVRRIASAWPAIRQEY